MNETPTPANTESRGHWAKDAFERVVATFVMAFLALYVPALLSAESGLVETLGDLGLLEKASVAGIAAIASLIKAGIAKKWGNRDSASLAKDV